MPMLLMDSVSDFLRKNPKYRPDTAEVSAIIYVLSCKSVGLKPSVDLISAITKRRNQQRAAN